MSSMPPPPPVFAAAGGMRGNAPVTDTTSDPSSVGVIRTNSEASGAKSSCVAKGYFTDLHLKHFVTGPPPKHPPLINRGYHARVATVRAVLDAFLDASFTCDEAVGKHRQVVSIGAGFDTNYFRLVGNENQNGSSTTTTLRYVELDFPSLMEDKARVINGSDELKKSIGKDGMGRIPQDVLSRSSDSRESLSYFSSSAKAYFLCGCDLREVSSLKSALKATTLDPTLPTLFLSECCLAYLTPGEAKGVLEWAASWGSDDELINESSNEKTKKVLRAYFAYDPIVIDILSIDKFGEQMLLNLTLRGCPLLRCEGEGAVIGAEGLKIEFESSGWRHIGAIDMLAATDKLIYENSPEMRRVNFIEPLDELEEFRLIQKHYCVAWGVASSGGGGDESDLFTIRNVVNREVVGGI